MASRIEIIPSAVGVSDVPVNIEIFDHELKTVAHEWVQINESKTYDVEPGLVGIRASLPSGAVVNQTVRVEPDQVKAYTLNLNLISPRKSQQWAYLTQSIPEAGSRLMSNPLYAGVWMRLWRRVVGTPAKWEVVPLPITSTEQGTWDEEGVTYRFRTPERGLYAVQIGGPKIPWKIAAIPSSYEVMVFVRPAPESAAAAHPLDIVISSGNNETESLLTLIQRGDITGAQSLNKQSQFAERLLFEKHNNTDGAAIGGYYLLRTRDLPRLHNWATNLANLFTWMADGPVIHAWQLILSTASPGESRQRQLDQARNRLLEAVSRGFPVYAEGLRLLRDGLLFFDRRSESSDPQISEALEQIGAYTSVADWTMTTTTFTGKSPDAPSEKSRKGTPRDKKNLIYVFDVPLTEVLRVTNLTSEDKLFTDISGHEIESQITSKGEIRMEDGSLFTSLGAAQQHISGDSRGSLENWRASSIELGDAINNLRVQSADA